MIVRSILVIVYPLWKTNQAFDHHFEDTIKTGDVELAHPLGSASQKLQGMQKINSPEINQGYTRRITVEVSPLAPSRLLQNLKQKIFGFDDSTVRQGCCYLKMGYSARFGILVIDRYT